LPADSATFHELSQAAKSGGFYMATRDAYECGIIELGDEEQRKDLALCVARKDREKRGLKKLSKLGPLRINHVTQPERIIDSVDQIISAQIMRFLATGRVSPLVHAQQRGFIKELAALLTDANWMKISQLEADGSPIAWNYGFRFHDGWFWYLPT